MKIPLTGLHHGAAALVLLVLSCPFLAEAQSPAFEQSHRDAVRANPPDIHLKIFLDSDKNTFRMGDSIVIKYQFTADAPGKYVAGDRSFDQSRRSTLESFVTDRPQDARDPLHDFWDLQNRLTAWTYSSSELHSLRLDTHPQFDSIELTHYLRFAKPGIYHLYVITRSAVRLPENENGEAGPPIASENTVELRLLPQDYSSAAADVDEITARAHQEGFPRFTQTEAFRLFEINTPKARSAALSLDGNWNRYAYTHSIALATLITAPTRMEAIRLLKRRVDNPELVVDTELLLDLSLLEFQEENPQVDGEQAVSANPATIAHWRSQYLEKVAANWRAVASRRKIRPPAVRAATVETLDSMAGYCFGTERLPLSSDETDRMRSEHLALLPDLPSGVLANALMNLRWAESLPNDQVLATLSGIYVNAPREDEGFIREVTLKEISKRSPSIAQHLFTQHVLRLDEPFDWNRIRYMTLPASRELDEELVRILEDRWTERMSRVAPIIGLYATDSILPRVKKVYEVYGPLWPCSIQAGLLTYFLRVDSGYGTEKMGPALAAYYDRGGSDCFRGNLLVDMALLRNAPELKPFVSAALNDSRPHVAAGGAQVTGFGYQGKVPLRDLLHRFRVLHDEWPDFAEKGESDLEYMNKWRSGYDELEGMLSVAFLNANDTPENKALAKEALQYCVTDSCRKSLRDHIARSRF